MPAPTSAVAATSASHATSAVPQPAGLPAAKQPSSRRCRQPRGRAPGPPAPGRLLPLSGQLCSRPAAQPATRLTRCCSGRQPHQPPAHRRWHPCSHRLAAAAAGGGRQAEHQSWSDLAPCCCSSRQPPPPSVPETKPNTPTTARSGTKRREKQPSGAAAGVAVLWPHRSHRELPPPSRPAFGLPPPPSRADHRAELTHPVFPPLPQVDPPRPVFSRSRLVWHSTVASARALGC